MSQKDSPVARNHELKKGEMKEDDDDYVSDSDDEDDEFSLWFELKSAWKQHFIAILVALLAASMGFFHLQEFTSSALLKNILPHAHLESYRRMANISFCDSSDVKEGYFLFEIPKKHLSSLESHYKGDEFGQQELKCAQAQTEQGSLLKGLSPLYRTPTLEDITPIVSAITNKNEKKIEAASLSFTGFGAKFVNLSPTPKLLFWDGRSVDDQRLVAEIPPMESIGTATTPGQSFSLTPVYDASTSLQRWTVTADEPILVYRSESEKVKDDVLQHKLQLQELNLVFAREYLIQTKRPWFSNFPRPPPSHPFWPADYLGQTHRVTAGDGDFTLKVSSVAPRVLEIDNFLTEQECQTLIATAQAKGLHPSTVVGDSAKNNAVVDSTTRSSTTTWLSRTHHELVDTIYRRAAHVFQVDDAALRHYHHEDAKYHSLAEELQIVRYASGQEYTPHHDYVVPSISDPHQPSRFATLLLYLQAPTRGGETTFPRALQAHNHDGLVVPPLTGKAILFYNLLPDGNVDDVSQHGSNAVVDGEKWIANLWIWDPMIG